MSVCDCALPQILNKSILTGQIEEIEQELQAIVNLRCFHAENPTKVHHRLLDGKLSVESYLLGHVTDSFSGYTRTFGAWPPTQNPNFTRVKSSPANDTGQQCGFTAP